MWSRRLKETLAMTLIGDGVVEVVAPVRHSLLWETGPEPARKVARFFAENPNLMRALGAVEIALGIWLALRQYEE
jgi:hypothetical protein